MPLNAFDFSPATIVSIVGDPVMALTFYDLPSWNTVMRSHWSKQGTKGLRADGSRLAQQFVFRLSRDERQQLFPIICAMLIVKVFTPNEKVRDIFNISIKAITDGFTDAKIWRDDEWATVPLTMLLWGGMDTQIKYKPGRVRKSPMIRTVVEVHRLARLSINGEALMLPRGRVYYE